MTTSDKLKLITNLSEKEVSQPQISVTYIDMISSDDEEYLRELKQKNRELAVDAILDDKVEEFEKYKESNPFTNSNENLPFSTSVVSSSMISPKILKANLNATPYQSDDDIYKTVISFLDQNTMSQKSTEKGPNTSLDVQLTGDFDQDRRRVITKIMMSSNIIAMDGRIGSGTSVICGQNVYQYINGEIFGNGLTHILDWTIDPDKVIVCRSSKQDQSGLILIKDEKNKNFFFGQTTRWSKQYCWFWVK
jgi:hypothetical protein